MKVPIDPACTQLLSTISSYLDGELDATACTEIERHCSSCPECARVVGALRQTLGLCRNAASTPLPESVRARARESIKRLLASERS